MTDRFCRGERGFLRCLAEGVVSPTARTIPKVNGTSLVSRARKGFFGAAGSADCRVLAASIVSAMFRGDEPPDPNRAQAAHRPLLRQRASSTPEPHCRPQHRARRGGSDGQRDAAVRPCTHPHRARLQSGRLTFETGGNRGDLACIVAQRNVEGDEQPAEQDAGRRNRRSDRLDRGLGCMRPDPERPASRLVPHVLLGDEPDRHCARKPPVLLEATAVALV